MPFLTVEFSIEAIVEPDATSVIVTAFTAAPAPAPLAATTIVFAFVLFSALTFALPLCTVLFSIFAFTLLSSVFTPATAVTPAPEPAIFAIKRTVFKLVF